MNKSDITKELREFSDWTQSEGDTSYSCNCVGPKNGQPRCPCLMRNVTIKDGRYVETKDLGPVK